MSKKIENTVQKFSTAMLNQMKEKEIQGWCSWDQRGAMKDAERSKGTLLERIISNALRGDWLDVANLAMIGWNLDNL